MATSVPGSAPNPVLLQQRAKTHKHEKCQRCGLKKKLHNCPLREGCSQSVFSLLSGLPITGPAIFVTLTAGGEAGVCFYMTSREEEEEMWHDVIRQ